MPPSAKTVARMPRCCSSAPTVGPTIRVLTDAALVQRRHDRVRGAAEQRPRLGPDRVEPNHDLVRRGITVGLHDCIGAAAGKRGPNLFEVRLVVKLHDDDRPAGELDALGHPVLPDVPDAGEDDHPRQDDRLPFPADEIEVGILEYVHMPVPCSPSP